MAEIEEKMRGSRWVYVFLLSRHWSLSGIIDCSNKSVLRECYGRTDLVCLYPKRCSWYSAFVGALHSQWQINCLPQNWGIQVTPVHHTDDLYCFWTLVSTDYWVSSHNDSFLNEQPQENSVFNKPFPFLLLCFEWAKTRKQTNKHKQTNKQTNKHRNIGRDLIL